MKVKDMSADDEFGAVHHSGRIFEGYAGPTGVFGDDHADRDKGWGKKVRRPGEPPREGV